MKTFKELRAWLKKQGCVVEDNKNAEGQQLIRHVATDRILRYRFAEKSCKALVDNFGISMEEELVAEVRNNVEKELSYIKGKK